jgi:putative flippase GtrA
MRIEIGIPGSTSASLTDEGATKLGDVQRHLRDRREEAAFVLVGAWNTFFAYSVWALLQILLGDRLNYLLILVLAWPFAVANAYACHRRFVFRSKGSIRSELPRFAVVYVVTLLASLLLLPFLLRTLPLNIFVIQAGFTACVVVFSYLAHKFVSFRSDDTPHGASRG